MNSLIKISLIVIFATSLCSSAFAFSLFNKNPMKTKSPSVNYLKDISAQGQVVRNKDVPLEKADIEADTERSIRLKNEFREQVKKNCKGVEIKK